MGEGALAEIQRRRSLPLCQAVIGAPRFCPWEVASYAPSHLTTARSWDVDFLRKQNTCVR